MADALDARDLGDSLLERVEVDPRLLLGVAIGSRDDFQNTGRSVSEARVQVPRRVETPQEEARSDEQHDGRRHLSHDEQIPQRSALGAATARRLVTQRGSEIRVRALERRSESEQDAGTDRDE